MNREFDLTPDRIVEPCLRRIKRAEKRVALADIIVPVAIGIIVAALYFSVAHAANAAKFPRTYTAVVKDGQVLTPEKFCNSL